MTDRSPYKPALAALASVAWAGVLLQLWLSIELALANGKTAVSGVVVFLGYFTVLTNLFVALTASAPLVASSSRAGRWFAKPMVLGAATVSIAVVGLGYHFLLRNVWQPQGLQLLADLVLHYAVPVLTLLYWLAVPIRSRLAVLAPLIWCLYPLAYIAYALARGAVLDSYPYYFMDVTRLGYAKVMLYCSGLLIAFIAVGAALAAVANARQRSVAPARQSRI